MVDVGDAIGFEIVLLDKLPDGCQLYVNGANPVPLDGDGVTFNCVAPYKHIVSVSELGLMVKPDIMYIVTESVLEQVVLKLLVTT